jgi:hypothetical protein
MISHLSRQDQGALESRDQERLRAFKELLIKYMNSLEDAFLLVLNRVITSRIV